MIFAEIVFDKSTSKIAKIEGLRGNEGIIGEPTTAVNPPSKGVAGPVIPEAAMNAAATPLRAALGTAAPFHIDKCPRREMSERHIGHYGKRYCIGGLLR